MTVSTSVAAAAGSSSAARSPLNAAARRSDVKQQAAIAQLEATDRHVRAHEQAHLIAAGAYATSGPSYTFAIGPDGQRYAVGGEVSLDTGPDPAGPEATVEKAKIIQRAANAPADPSSQDRMVAAEAALMEADAELEIAAEQRHGRQGYGAGQTPAAGQLIAVAL